MKKKSICKLISVILVNSIFLTACGSIKMSSDEQTKFVQEVKNMIGENKELNKCVSQVDSKIKKMDKDKSTEVIDGLITIMYVNLESMSAKVQAFQEDLKQLEDKNIDLNSKEAIEKSSNSSVRGLLEDVKSKKLIIKSEAGKYYIVPDLNFINNKYKEYMNDDLKEIIAFRIEENEKPVFKQKSESFDLELVESRLKRIQENEKKYEKSGYYKQWLQYEEIYYGIIFGKSHPFFVDKNNKVMDSIIAFYEKIITDLPEAQIGKDMKIYLELLKKNNNIINDEVEKVSDNFIKSIEDNFEKIYQQEQEKENKNIEKNLKNAIEENDTNNTTSDKTNNKK